MSPTNQEVQVLHKDQVKKLTRVWSLPYRVVEVRSKGKAARVKGTLTDTERLVHIQKVKFIRRPRTAVQMKQWEEETRSFVRDMKHGRGEDWTDRELHLYVNAFWGALEAVRYDLSHAILGEIITREVNENDRNEPGVYIGEGEDAEDEV